MFGKDDPDFDPDARVCPKCGSEFQPHVQTCIDCGAATVPASDVAGQALPGPTPSLGNRFSLPEDREAIRTPSRDVEGAEDFGMFLERHGVPCRLEMEEPPASAVFRKRRPPRFYVCVAPEDAERTLEMMRRYDQIQIRATGMRFENLPPLGVCPACGTKAGEGTEWCPECGLHLGGDDVEDGESTVEKDSG
jgi:hypothetical protein